MGLPYPGGPVIDRLAKEGNPKAFRLAHPHVDGYDYSFSGLKTSFLYMLRDAVAGDPDFIERNKADLCASLQSTIVEILLDKLVRASKDTGIRDIAIAGAYRPTRDCATASSSRASSAAGARSCRNSSSRPTTPR